MAQITPAMLSELVTVIAALSVTSERLVEIIKGVIPWLGTPQDDKTYQERLRGAALQLLAVFAGVLTTYLGSNYFPSDWQSILSAHASSYLVLGLLASGGSGLWNSILSYVGNVKDLKKATAVMAKNSVGIA